MFWTVQTAALTSSNPMLRNLVQNHLSKLKDQAAARPGYGFVATPSAQEWTHRQSGQDENLSVLTPGGRERRSPTDEREHQPGLIFDQQDMRIPCGFSVSPWGLPPTITIVMSPPRVSGNTALVVGVRLAVPFSP